MIVPRRVCLCSYIIRKLTLHWMERTTPERQRQIGPRVFYAAFNITSVISRQQHTNSCISLVHQYKARALKCLAQEYSQEKPGEFSEPRTLGKRRLGPAFTVITDFTTFKTKHLKVTQLLIG